MSEFVITHGLFKHASHVAPKDGSPLKHKHAERIDNGFLGPSADPSKPHTVELTEKDAERMDPGCTAKEYAGHCLKPLAQHEAEVKAAAAAKAEIDKGKAEVKAAAAKAGGK